MKDQNDPERPRPNDRAKKAVTLPAQLVPRSAFFTDIDRFCSSNRQPAANNVWSQSPRSYLSKMLPATIFKIALLRPQSALEQTEQQMLGGVEGCRCRRRAP